MNSGRSSKISGRSSKIIELNFVVDEIYKTLYNGPRKLDREIR